MSVIYLDPKEVQKNQLIKQNEEKNKPNWLYLSGP